MSEFVFQPLMSFNARCYWQFSGAFIDPAKWHHAGDRFKPVWVEFNDWNGDDGWLMSGRDYSPREVQSFIVDHVAPGTRQRVHCEQFWFGVFRFGDDYVYEIRPAYAGANLDRHPQLEYQLALSRGGYLGMYPTELPAGTSPLVVPARITFDLPDPLPEVGFEVPETDIPAIETRLVRHRHSLRTPLWSIDGLDPASLAAGERYTNLTLISPSGRTVRRYLEKGRAYLHEKNGVRGLMTLEIVEAIVPPHSIFTQHQ